MSVSNKQVTISYLFGSSAIPQELASDALVAPSQRMASSVLANVEQVVKEGEIRIHPMVARQVEPELLRKMGATVDGAKDG